MPRKGENIEKSEIFFSFRINDKTDKTCRGSKKRHPHGCLSSIFALFVSIYCYAYIILYVIVHYVFYYRIYCRIAAVFPISADRLRFCTFVLRGVQKTPARASVRQRIFHHVREMTQGQFAVVTQRHQILRFFPIEKQIRKAQ